MNQPELERKVVETDLRLARVEQILPPVVTQDEFETAIATLATKGDLKQVEDRLWGALGRQADETRQLRNDMKGGPTGAERRDAGEGTIAAQAIEITARQAINPALCLVSGLPAKLRLKPSRRRILARKLSQSPAARGPDSF